MNKTGKLYLCATPIGNLEDITLRVLRTLKEVDLIAAEDTRNSIKLLNHFDIKTPMTSYHEYNKIDKGHVLVEKMLEGTDIALITDAGTPSISDPGEELAAMCYEAGFVVTSLPGPAACITALTLSGLHTRRFAFEAFLPADAKIFGMTACLPVTLQGLVGCHGKVWGLESFGFSAPIKVLDEKLGFTAENVYNQVKAML